MSSTSSGPTGHLFAVPGALWINRQRQRDQPDVFICWRPHESRLLTSLEAVLMFAADPLDSDQLEALREWLVPTPSTAGALVDEPPDQLAN